MLRARPCGQIVAAFGHQLERKIGANAVDLRQILAEQGVERLANVKSRAVRLPAAAAPRRR